MPWIFKYLFVFRFSRNFRERLTRNFLEKSSVAISQEYPICLQKLDFYYKENNLRHKSLGPYGIGQPTF